jgi:hypothetical protein
LDHLQTVYIKKSRKKQTKQRLKESSIICSELEEYILQKWTPYILQKIDSGSSNGSLLVGSLLRDVDHSLKELQKNLEVRSFVVSMLTESH